MESLHFANLKVVISEQGNVMTLEVSGFYSLEGFKQLIEVIQAECEKRGKELVLGDISTVQGNMPAIDRYTLGEYVSQSFGYRIKLAFVSVPEKINHLAENVAVNRGARVQAFTKRDEALKWLQS